MNKISSKQFKLIASGRAFMMPEGNYVFTHGHPTDGHPMGEYATFVEDGTTRVELTVFESMPSRMSIVRMVTAMAFYAKQARYMRVIGPNEDGTRFNEEWDLTTLRKPKENRS